jgi:asparagine synthase (glutamine-hydrolysing)
MQLTDTVISAQDHLPFNPCGRRFAGPHDPASSYYSEAFDAVAHTAAAQGVKLMLTGFGADEVMSTPGPTEPTPPDLPPWLGPRALAALDQINTNTAPPTAVSAPTLMACASHSPAYLAAGIWPIAPFANPAVGRFARQLPAEWAADKRLLRERLMRAGIPSLAARPQDGEDFTPIMHQALRAHALPLLNELADSLTLASLGFVDPAALHDTLKRAHDTPTPPSTLVDLLRLELGLRSLWRSEQTPTAVSAARHNEQPHHRPDDERRADAAALA